MKKLNLLGLSVLLVFAGSCIEEIEVPKSLEWVPARFIQFGASFSSFETGDDGSLYTLASINGEYGFYKWTGSNWQVFANLEWGQYIINDFTIYKQNAYFIDVDQNQRSLWSVKSNLIEKVNLEGLAIEVTNFKNKLVVAGQFTDALGNTAGLVHSENGTDFTPIPSSGTSLTTGFLLRTGNQKLFVTNSGQPQSTFEYDGVTLKNTGFAGGYQFIDQDNSFYFINNSPNEKQEVNKYSNGQVSVLGSPLENKNIDTVFLVDDILIAMGTNRTTNLSETFCLVNNQWSQITTTNLLQRFFKYEDKTYVFDYYGVVLELASVQR